MNYDQARNKIETGDLIAVKGKTGFLTPFTKFFTRSQYTHVGIAFWMNGGLWMSEINGGRNHAIPLSQLAEDEFDVYARPDGIAIADMLDAINEALRVRIDYGYLSLPVIGLLDFLRIKAFIHARRIMSCAGFSVMTYEAAGWPEHTRILSPADLAALLKFKFAVGTGGARSPALTPTPVRTTVAA